MKCADAMLAILRAVMPQRRHAAAFAARMATDDEAHTFVLPMLDRTKAFQILPGFFESDNAASPIFSHYTETECRC